MKYLAMNEGVRISQILADLGNRATAIENGRNGALTSVERCSTGGSALLRELLRFRDNGPLDAIAVTSPAEPRQTRTVAWHRHAQSLPPTGLTAIASVVEPVGLL